MSRSYRWSIAVAAAFAFAAPLSAQQTLSAQVRAGPIAATYLQAMAPAVTLAAVPITGSPIATVSTTAPPLAPMPRVMGQRQSVALMVVGGVGMVVGSLIDGDTGTIIMVGGGLVGLVGLFQYLR